MSELKKRKVEDKDYESDYQKEMNDKINKILKSKKKIIIDDNKEKTNDIKGDEDIFESEEKIEDEFYKLITVFSDKLDIYLDYDKILESFIESIIDNNDGIKNRCTECNVDMGYSNPRQLCGKTYCMNI
jgi:hypothetical protein